MNNSGMLKLINFFLFILLLKLNTTIAQTSDEYYSHMNNKNCEAIRNLIESERKIGEDDSYLFVYKNFITCDSFLFTEYLVKNELLFWNSILNNNKTPLEIAYLCENRAFIAYVLTNKIAELPSIVSLSNDTIFLKYIVNKSNINIQNKEGKTFLHYASEFSADTTFIDFLINKGANLLSKSNLDEYPIECAINNSNEDIFLFLLNKYNSSKIEKNNRNLMNLAMLRGKQNAISILLKECPLNILNTVDEDGGFMFDNAIDYTMTLFPQEYFNSNSKTEDNEGKFQFFNFLCEKGLNISYFLEQKPNTLNRILYYPDMILYFLNKDIKDCKKLKSYDLLSEIIVDPVLEILKTEGIKREYNKYVINNKVEKYLQILDLLCKSKEAKNSEGCSNLWTPLINECKKNDLVFFIEYLNTRSK